MVAQRYIRHASRLYTAYRRWFMARKTKAVPQVGAARRRQCRMNAAAISRQVGAA